MNKQDYEFFKDRLDTVSFKSDCLINHNLLQGFFVEKEMYEIRLILAEMRKYVDGRKGNN